MPILMKPAALWAILAAVVLVAIYLFRRQAKEVEVSSLMFFARFRHNAEGGSRLARPQAPLVLLLEIIILSLLVVAAANPKAVTGEKLVPMVVILDDSMSMAVNEPDSPRNAAAEYLQTQVFSRPECRFTLIRTGIQPEIIGRHDMTGIEAGRVIEEWRCRAPDADLLKAIAYAGENFTEKHGVLVVSDRDHERSSDSAIRWLAFGRKLDNLAVTAASRYSTGNQDRCYFAFTSFASGSTALAAEIILPDKNEILERVTATLRPGESRRVRVMVKDQNLRVQARILNDPVAYDNEAWLLPVKPEPVSVELRSVPEFLKHNVARAISASGLATIVASAAQLIVSDGPVADLPDNVWQLVFRIASQPVAFAGNVAVDKAHPLTAGLPGVRAAWAVDQSYLPPGKPLMSVGTMPLIAVAGMPTQNISVFFNLAPDFSDLHKTVLWPTLFWNLLAWRQKYNDGPDAFNYRSGNEITLTLPEGSNKAQMLDSDGKLFDSAVAYGRQAVFTASTPGFYEIGSAARAWKIAVNLCSASESDLRHAVRFVPPHVPFPESSMQQFSEVRWWFILPALLLICLHQYLTSRRPADVFF